MKTLLTIAFTLACLAVRAQTEKKSVVIGSMISKPNALLIINPPDANQGVILPQLTTLQRLELKPSSPSEDGLIVFDTDVDAYFYWSDEASSACGSNTKNDLSRPHIAFRYPAGCARHNAIAMRWYLRLFTRHIQRFDPAH